MHETQLTHIKKYSAPFANLWVRIGEHRLWITTLLVVGSLLVAETFFFSLVSHLASLSPWVRRLAYGSFLLLISAPVIIWAIYRGIRTDAADLNDSLGHQTPTQQKSPHRKVRAAMIATVASICTLVGLSHFNDINVAAQAQREGAAINQAEHLAIQCTRLSWLASLPMETNHSLRLIATAKMTETIAQIERVDSQLHECLESFNHQPGDVASSLPAWVDAGNCYHESLVQEAMKLVTFARNGNGSRLTDQVAQVRALCEHYRIHLEQLVATLEQTRALTLDEETETKYASIIAMAVMFFVLMFAVVEPTTRLVRLQHEKMISQNASLTRLATVAQRTTNVVIIADADGGITWVNDGFTRLTGYRLEDVSGTRLDEFHRSEKAASESLQWMTAAIQAQKPYRCELINRGKDGREFWIDIDLQPQEDAHGRTIGFVAVENDITAQVLEREWLRSTFAAVAEGIVQLNLAGEIVSCNPAAERILGKSSQELMHLHAQDPCWGITREDGTPMPAEEHPVLATLRSGKSIRNCVHGICLHSGERRMISLSTEPIWDADGEIVAAVASFVDVTEQHEQSKRMELVINGGGLGTWDWDVPTGHVVYNEHWAGMLGYTVGEIASHVSVWESLVHPDDMTYAFPLLEDHLNGRSVEYKCELRMKRKDGSYAWIFTAGKVLHRDEEGKPLRVLGMHIDISSRKHAELEMIAAKSYAEQALREINALRSALDEHSILSVADQDGRITDVNTGFSRISGYSREELIGKDHRMLSSGVHPPTFWAEVRDKITKGKTWRGEVCNRRKDGSLYWVDSTIVPHRNAKGEIEKYVSIRFDVTAQKEAEEALVAAQSQAEAANAAKTEFLANMSHEIRTPMTAILGFTELLATDGHRDRAPHRRLEYIETIRRNGEHLLEIINDILDISKIEARKMDVECVPTPPASLVQEVLSLMDVRAKAKGLLFEAVFENAIPATIQTDPVRVRQILVNLVGNALKFTEIGSVLLKIRTDLETNMIHFSVTDTGIGMREDQIEKLFEAFVQADASTTRRFGGTGLGLRISKRLAEMLGGDIGVQSVLGSGSTFTASIACGDLSGIELLSPEHAAAPVRDNLVLASDLGAANATNRRLLEGMRILLAEDGPDNQRLIAHFLRKAGAEVCVVENGKLAVESLTVDNTLDGEMIMPVPFDLLVTDMQMPEMDGYAATRLLRARGCQLPIVALTANAMNSDMERCLQAGCDDYATKPIDKYKLIETCLRWGHTGNLLDEPTAPPNQDGLLGPAAVLNLFHDLMASPQVVEQTLEASLLPLTQIIP